MVDISGNINQCFKYFLNAFYRDITEIKKAIILWSVAHWSQYPLCRTNDNAFIFNWMLGYNIVLLNDLDKKWQWNRVNNFPQRVT